MSSKRSAKPSAASQCYQGNKEAAGTGHITQDPLFEAIAYVRYRGWAERNLERDFAAAEDQEFERFSIRDSLVSNKLIPKGLIDILDDQLGAQKITNMKNCSPANSLLLYAEGTLLG
jgi:hypothetical protein